MTRYARLAENGIGAIKYLLAGLTVLGGVSAMLAPLTPVSGPLGFLYGYRLTLVLFGVVVVGCGLALLYGKIRHSRRWTGRGLMAVYCSFLFATLVQIAAFGFHPSYWLLNAIFTVLSGALWLRWKFKTEYVNPKHFREDVLNLK